VLVRCVGTSDGVPVWSVFPSPDMVCDVLHELSVRISAVGSGETLEHEVRLALTRSWGLQLTGVLACNSRDGLGRDTKCQSRVDGVLFQLAVSCTHEVFRVRNLCTTCPGTCAVC